MRSSSTYVLHDAQDRAQFAQVVKFRLIEQMLRARRRRFADRCGARCETRPAARCGSRPCTITVSHTRSIAAGEMSSITLAAEHRIERVGQSRELIGIDVGLPVDLFLRRDTHRGHDDDEARARGKPQQLHVLERMRVARGRDRDRHIARETGEQARRLIDHAVELAAGLAELIPDPARVDSSSGSGFIRRSTNVR